MPKVIEKELFTVIVHENQFVVSAQRIHHLLDPQKPFPRWANDVVGYNLLEENVDYWYRQSTKDSSINPHNHLVFSLYAIKRIIVGDYYNKVGKIVFRYCSLVHERMVNVALTYLGYYLSYKVEWKPRNGVKLYNMGRVLESAGAVPAAEKKLRLKFPQHFTEVEGQPYMSYDLTHLLHMQHWVRQQEAFVMQQMHPFKEMMEQ